ncbi:glutaredoxin domain-containing protein [Vacuolonema iberomarrocanum]|uniref:glutaredoxin domain-containing protein n=1 Tax=Vacuolonema iberomarrocanum TaxID=3454632 RepID=UPI001A0A5A7D|nr:glutaredoxin family protein [filamentous cyanobacterium LEGE 07170]
MPQPNIVLFSKSNCSYCDRAKAVLHKVGLAYENYDVTTNNDNASAAIYFSGVATVPQTFIGAYHINGAEDLEQLDATGQLDAILTIARGSALPFDSMSSDTLHQGADDWVLREVIPQSDGSHSQDPESWPILHFYKQFFGFWPNTFAYLHHWPEAYKLFVYCHNFSAVNYGKKELGPVNMFAVAYSTSNAHGCSYCQVHSAATGGEHSLNVVQQYKQAREGDMDAANPFGALELAIAELAADATRNQVTTTHIKKIVGLAGAPKQAQGYIKGVEMMVAAFGFLNVFNDLTGLELEGQWAEQASTQSSIDAGRHTAQSVNPSNLDYEIPTGGPSIEQMLAKYNREIDDLTAYAEREFGLLPDWMQHWPAPLRKHHAYLYGELMGDRDHTVLPADLKHLMARTSAIAKNHDYLAAIEGFMAHHCATDKARAIERIRHCFAVATGTTFRPDLFSQREQAALQLAWLSAQSPLTTPRRFIQAAVERYSPQELVHLIVVCSVASMVQRFVAIAKPDLEVKVVEFLITYDLTFDTLTLRYSQLSSQSTTPQLSIN